MDFSTNFDSILKRITKDKKNLPKKEEDCCYYIHDMNIICDKKEKCCIKIEMTMKHCPHWNTRKEYI